MVSAHPLPVPLSKINPLRRPHQEFKRAPPEDPRNMSKIRRIAANLPRPTPLQQTVGRALDQASYL